MKVTAIIPTLNPTEKLFTVINQLGEHGFSDIIIVDDGSDERCRPIFSTVERTPGCTLLAHPCNEGKGQALKTAFRHYLEHTGEQVGVITLDDDGQHDMDGIVACAHALEANSASLILGTRDFNAANVPPKSRYGNKVTSAVFALFCGLNISDTQTGLRGIPNRMLPLLTELDGERFEYETNMLLVTKRHNIPIMEVPIRTIYVEGNKSTHFRPLIDSLRIYSRLLSFLCSSLLAFAVDIALFWLICRLLPASVSTRTRVFAATLSARAVSSVVNFLTNRNIVFRQNDLLLHSAVRYYLLCIVQALASSLLVSWLGILSSGRRLVPLKILTDAVFALVSFQIQKRWVFHPTKREVQKV